MSDYLNQKMEGLKKAFNAHWGEVMNRPSLIEPLITNHEFVQVTDDPTLDEQDLLGPTHVRHKT